MNWQKISSYMYVWWMDTKEFSRKIKRRIWNKHLLLWWYRLWIRKDEFHPSLNIDPLALMEMNKQEQNKYREDLIRRRAIVHQRYFDK